MKPKMNFNSKPFLVSLQHVCFFWKEKPPKGKLTPMVLWAFDLQHYASEILYLLFYIFLDKFNWFIINHSDSVHQYFNNKLVGHSISCVSVEFWQAVLVHLPAFSLHCYDLPVVTSSFVAFGCKYRERHKKVTVTVWVEFLLTWLLLWAIIELTLVFISVKLFS